MLKRSKSSSLRKHLLQQLKALGTQFWPNKCIASDVPSRSGKARNQAVGHGISHTFGDNWDRICRPFCGKSSWGTRCHDHVNAKLYKLVYCVVQLVRATSRISIFNRDILAPSIAILAKPPQKGLFDPDRHLIGGSPQPNNTYEGYVPLRSLCASSGRAQHRNTGQRCDKIA